jgi:hypothetical protein
VHNLRNILLQSFNKFGGAIDNDSIIYWLQIVELTFNSSSSSHKITFIKSYAKKQFLSNHKIKKYPEKDKWEA